MAAPTTQPPVPNTVPATSSPIPVVNSNAPLVINGPSPYASASLYIGDLAPEVTEANLFEIFNNVGPVASIRVCRDAITRRSLGYAYVNFHAATDAERALDQLNGTNIKDRPCRIMWSQRDPSMRKSGKGNIFIKNLDKNIDHKALYDTFSQFGQIISCKIELNERNESRGFGYIQFATQDAAENAIAKVNGMMLIGKRVFVGPFVANKERLANANAKEYTNIFIKNLPDDVDEKKLREIFTVYGPIKSAVIMADDKGKSKCFGFINFEDTASAKKAVEETNNTEIGGKTVYVGRAQKRHEREAELRHKFEVMKLEQMSKYQGVNLYVKNLDDEIDDTKLRSVFDQFGTITSAKVMNDTKGNSRGFGFVCFTTPEEATKAVTEMNGKMVGNKPLYVGLAQRKDQRKVQLEQQFAARKQLLGAPRMPGPAPQLYNGQPMFFAQAPGQPGFMYPQMVPRGRFPPAPYQQQPMPNYVMMPGASRGGQPIKTPGRGGPQAIPAGPRRAGMKQGMPQQAPHPASGNAPAPIPMAVPGAVPMPVPVPVSPEEQKRLLGEKLYSLISLTQPQLAGKITGMILDSSPLEEIVQLIDVPQALSDKIDEALKVLQEANMTNPQD